MTMRVLVKVRGKVLPRTGHKIPEGEQMYNSTPPLISALDGGGGQHQTPATLPMGKTRYLLHGRLGRPQDRSGEVWKISPPIGIQSLDCPTLGASLY